MGQVSQNKHSTLAGFSKAGRNRARWSAGLRKLIPTSGGYHQHMDLGTFAFERVRRWHFELLSRWLAEPHVARWSCQDPATASVVATFGPSADGLEPAGDYIALHAGLPVGLVRFARFVDRPEHLEEMEEVYPVGAGAATVDCLVGDPSQVGRGLGSALITTFVEFAWEQHPDITHLVRRVNPDNIAWGRALRRAGFRLVARGDIKPDSADSADSATEGWSHDVFRKDRHERTEVDMIAAALEMDPALLPYAVELLADFDELAGTIDEADAVVYAALGDVIAPLDETIRTIRLYAKPGGHIVVAD